jgi:hypothetical protein
VEEVEEHFSDRREEEDNGEGNEQLAQDDFSLPSRGHLAQYGEKNGDIPHRVHEEKEGTSK